jgi:hypothetical protein
VLLLASSGVGLVGMLLGAELVIPATLFKGPLTSGPFLVYASAGSGTYRCVSIQAATSSSL